MKELIKTFANGVCFALVLPAIFSMWVQSLVLDRNYVLASWSQLFSIIPGNVGVYLRRTFYNVTLQDAGTDCVISFGVLFSSSETSIGRKSYVGPYCIIGEATISDDVLIGSQVSIMNGTKQHGIDRLDIPVREQPGEWPRLIIGEDTWIGDRTVVMADIGAHCVIGAGSVVTKPIPDFAIAVGNPARIIRYRNENSPAAISEEAKPPNA